MALVRLVALALAALAPLASADSALCLVNAQPASVVACSDAFHQLWLDLTGCDGRTFIPFGSAAKVGHEDSAGGCQAWIYSTPSHAGLVVDSSAVLDAFNGAWGSCSGNTWGIWNSDLGFVAGFRPSNLGLKARGEEAPQPSRRRRTRLSLADRGAEAEAAAASSSGLDLVRTASKHNSSAAAAAALAPRVNCGNPRTVHNMVHCVLKRFNQGPFVGAFTLTSTTANAVATFFANKINNDATERMYDVDIQLTAGTATARALWARFAITDLSQGWEAMQTALVGGTTMRDELINMIQFMSTEGLQSSTNVLRDIHTDETLADVLVELYLN